jgi:hypothetical protein
MQLQTTQDHFDESLLYIYVFIGMFVILIALFRREWLIQKQTFRVIMLISFIMFAVGLILHFTTVGRATPSGALLAPLLTLGFFRISLRIFLRRLQHEPKDTYLNWKAGLGADRIFNIVFFTVAGWLLLCSIIGMDALAKAGW